jgi:hypothetical protein
MAVMLVGLAAPALAAAPDVQNGIEVSMPFDYPTETDAWPADGVSTFRRTANGMSVHLDAEGLEPNHVYSAWWLIAADVVKGDDGCFPTDIFELNATGAVANKKGDATFAAHISTGPIGPVDGEVILTNEQPTAGYGNGALDDPLRNHVNVILIDHGPKDDLQVGNVAQNMFTILGGMPPPDLIHDSPSQWVIDNCFDE